MISSGFVDPEKDIWPVLVRELGINYSDYRDLLPAWTREAIRKTGVTPETHGVQSADYAITNDSFPKPCDVEQIISIQLYNSDSGAWIYGVYDGVKPSSIIQGDVKLYPNITYGKLAATPTGFFLAPRPAAAYDSELVNRLTFDRARVWFTGMIFDECNSFPLVPKLYEAPVKAYIIWRVTYMQRCRERGVVPQSEVDMAERAFYMEARGAYAEVKMPSRLEIREWIDRTYSNGILGKIANQPY